MEIRTFDTIYSVIHAEKSENMMPVYLCKNQTNKELYHLFRMEKSFLEEETITFLNAQFQNEHFTDFSDLFLYEGKFYAALRYYFIPSLEDRMKDYLEMEERLVIGSKILECFLLTSMPPYFCCQCLATNRVLLTDSLDIRFDYTLDDIEMAPAMTMQDCYDAYANLLEKLWKVELKNKTVPEIQAFIQFLHSAGNTSVEFVYQSYREMHQEFMQTREEERKKPRKFLFVLWGQLKKGIPWVKKLAAILILLGTIAYLIYTIQDGQKIVEEKDNADIHYIGTLNVEE